MRTARIIYFLLAKTGTAVLAFGMSILLLTPGFAKQTYNKGVLADPVVRGAWLYKSRCVRCHDTYESDGLAADYESKTELIEAISDGGCQVSWAAHRGGEFGRKEISALALYLLTFEEEGAEPVLPDDVPPLLPERTETSASKPEQEQKKFEPEKEKNKAPSKQLTPALAELLRTNTIAHGAYLYTSNCYRCHLSYEQARMGKDLAYPVVYRTIVEGKTSTQMQPFSRTLGGNLRNTEIKAISDYIFTWEAAGEPLALAEQLITPPSLDPSNLAPIRLTRFKPVDGSPFLGQKLFTVHCIRCHGQNGEGYIGPSLQKKISLRPDLSIKSALKQGVPHTLMRSQDQNQGGILSSREMSNLVAYILDLQNNGR